MDEFAMGSSTEHSAFGPTRNPHDLGRVPGGSSGGSAAAVAAGFAPVALGTDTGGSIRQPAALCGVVGAKPTYGLVSRYGLVAFASSLDQIGPFATNVADAALLLDTISWPRPVDSTSLPGPAARGVRNLGRGVEGLRVGVIAELAGAEGIAADVAARLARSGRCPGRGRRQGGRSQRARGALRAVRLLPDRPGGGVVQPGPIRRRPLRPAGGPGADITEMYMATRSAGFGPEVKRRIMLGTYALSAGYYDAYYGKAQQVRTLIIRDFEEAYRSFDVLLSPTAPTTAFALGAKTADPLTMYLNDVCTIPSNLAGHPAISVPFGTGDDGLPVGVQVLAPALGETVMFQVAAGAGGGRADSGPGTGRNEPATAPSAGWETVIGLEVHCELRTATKLFCGCRNTFGDEPNTNVCPVCLGLPGSLPVLNRQAVEYAMRIGDGPALPGRSPRSSTGRTTSIRTCPRTTRSASTTSPSMPTAGWSCPSGRRVGIVRAHMEEDTGKTTHVGGGGRIHEAAHSLVDYNRAGVPLVEIVCAPDMRSAEEARDYVEELRAILVATGASDGKMEEGSLRVDCQRVGPPGGLDRVRDPLRDQEHELVA